MPDFDKIANYSNLFAAMSAILFSVWYVEIDKVLDTEMPRIFDNRDSYRRSLMVTLISKSIPIVVILLAYIFCLFGPLSYVFWHFRLMLQPSKIESVPTLFVITYFLSLYFLIMSGHQLFSLIRRMNNSYKKRGGGPKATTI